MSTERDTTRIVRSWLRTDEHESADRVLDIVLARLDTTPQRRLMWPARRFVALNNIAKVAIAAAAVVIVAVVAINLLPSKGGVGPTVSPSPTATATPVASPTVASAAFLRPGRIPVGRYSMIREGIPMSLAVPSTAWFSDGQHSISFGQSTFMAGFIFWIGTPDGVYANPCAAVRAPVVANPTAASLAAAVSTIPGLTRVSGPADVTVGGHAAKLVVLTVPEGIGCQPELFKLWYDSTIGERWATAVGETFRVWIVDVNGKLVWIDAETVKDAHPTLISDVQGIVDSIRFE